MLNPELDAREQIIHISTLEGVVLAQSKLLGG